MTTTTLVLLVLFAVILFVYMARRRSRLTKED